MTNNQRYRRFTPHRDNVQEIISADHVNRLQDGIQGNQKELFRQEDVDFLDRSLFILEHHPVVNALYVDLLESPSKLDIPASPGLAFSTEERGVSFDTSGPIQATLNGRLFQNPNNTNIKEIVFVANQTTPAASRINFFISNNGLDFYPITPNNSAVFTFPTTGSRLQIRAEFIRTSSADLSPLLKGYAILYRDPQYVVNLLEKSPFTGDGTEIVFQSVSHNDLTDVGPDDHHPKEHAHDGEDGSGLISHKSLIEIGEDDHHAKNHQHGQDGVDAINLSTDVIGTLGLEHLGHIWKTGKPGELVLTRNPLAEDKLVRVTSPESDTYLLYDWGNEGRLGTVVTVFKDIAVEEVLNYADYTSSEGETEEVMVGTTKYIRDIQEIDVDELQRITMAPASQSGGNGDATN